MSKKYLALLVIPALILVVALMAVPRDASATQLLGITITPTPTETQPEPPTATPTVTEEPQEPTPTPTVVTQTPLETPRPNPTEIVLLPETGEFPIDPAQGIQWLFVLTMIFIIGIILFRTFRTAKIKNK
jgi:hypothetical protein